MIQVQFQRNLIGIEDLLLGVGTVTQIRGITPVTVTKINGSLLPYDNTYTLKQKFDTLTAAIASLPNVVDGGGNLLTGLIDHSAADLSANHAGRIWQKDISGTEADIYYGSILMFKYNPAVGNLITTFTNDYIAADTVVTNAYIAADAVVTAAYQAADADLEADFGEADAVVTAAYIAADAIVSAAYIAADTVLASEIEHRVSVTQQADIAASSNVTKTITYTNGSSVKVTVSSAFTFAFVFPVTEVCSFLLEIVNGGSQSITWPAMKWPGGAPPALTIAGTDHLVIYQDGSNTIYGALIGNDIK